MSEHDPQQALLRLWNDIRHPLSPNPEDEDLRAGWLDLSHAYSNAWVEVLRASFGVPDDEKGTGWHWAGRSIAWSTPIWLGLPFILLA